MVNDSENVERDATVNPAGSVALPNSAVAQLRNPMENEQKVKLGTLVVQLVANDQFIASSQDPKLWQDVLAVITGHAPQSLRRSAPDTNQSDQESVLESKQQQNTAQKNEDREDLNNEFPKDLIKFAHDIGATPEEVVAACDPRDEEPYLHLDHRAWEEMKRQTPSSGPKSISPIIPAATLLALWFKQKKLGSPTVKQAQDVLRTIELRDQKPARALRNREWLQLKDDDRIVLNPARLSKAIGFAGSFCTHRWNQENK
jgi:hypothetical protein